jgi:hypothetical protein
MNATTKLRAGLCLALALLVSTGCSTTQVSTKGKYYVPGESWVSVSRESLHNEPERTFHFDWANDRFWERNGLRGNVEAYTMTIAPHREGEVVSAMLEHSSLSGGEAKHGTCFFQLNMLLRVVNHLPSGEVVRDRLIPLKSDRFVIRSEGPACSPSSQDIGSALRRAFDLYAIKA